MPVTTKHAPCACPIYPDNTQPHARTCPNHHPIGGQRWIDAGNTWVWHLGIGAWIPVRAGR